MQQIELKYRDREGVYVPAKLFGKGNVAVSKTAVFWGLPEGSIVPKLLDQSYTLIHVPTGLSIWPNSFGYRRNTWACAEAIAYWFDQFCDKCQQNLDKAATIEQINELKLIIKEHYKNDINGLDRMIGGWEND